MTDSNHLTPVRIRGKRSPKKPAPTASASSTSSDPSPHRHDQEHNSLSATPAAKPKKRRRKNDEEITKQPDKGPSLAPLERLPVELLEKIFFDCLNLNFPRASVAIGERLASNHVKTKLYIMVFAYKFTDHEDSAIASTIKDHPLVDGDGQPLTNLQSGVLALRWMTPTFLQLSMQKLMFKAIITQINKQDFSHVSRKRSNNLASFIKPIIEFISESSEAMQSSSDRRWSVIDTKRRTMSLSERQEVEVLLEFHQQFPHYACVKLPVYESLYLPVYVNHTVVFSCLHKCRIPQKLLHGPWDTSKCAMLAHIMKAGCGIDRSGNTTDEEVVNQGLIDAIIQPCIRAIVILVGSTRQYSAESSSSSSSSCEADLIGECDVIINRCHVGVTVTTEHLKLALVTDSSLQVLECLADAISWAVDWRNRDIRAWAFEKRKQGDLRGQFLVDKCDDADRIEQWRRRVLS